MATWKGLDNAPRKLGDWLRSIGAGDSRTLAGLFSAEELQEGEAPALFLSPIVSADTEETIGLLGQFVRLIESARSWGDNRNKHFAEMKPWEPAARHEKRRRRDAW